MPITIDGLDEAHAKVALDILTADGGSWTVYKGSVGPLPTKPYVLVYTVVEWPGVGISNALDGRSGTCVTRWYTHSVGESDQGTRAVANRVRQLLVNVRPTIAGRSCGFIQQETALPFQRDETTGALIQDLTAVYILTTT